ncbi:putative retrotransposon hot spot protein 4 (RHS4) [Trypanosoma vivax]|nr:putative retrotransposon hot spot protein 4 (RHS4) [Trypanosoma vivax]
MSLKKALRAQFSNWEDFTRDAQWEVIYFQPDRAEKMRAWQQCAISSGMDQDADHKGRARVLEREGAAVPEVCLWIRVACSCAAPINVMACIAACVENTACEGSEFRATLPCTRRVHDAAAALFIAGTLVAARPHFPQR